MRSEKSFVHIMIALGVSDANTMLCSAMIVPLVRDIIKFQITFMYASLLHCLIVIHCIVDIDLISIFLQKYSNSLTPKQHERPTHGLYRV